MAIVYNPTVGWQLLRYAPSGRCLDRVESLAQSHPAQPHARQLLSLPPQSPRATNSDAISGAQTGMQAQSCDSAAPLPIHLTKDLNDRLWEAHIELVLCESIDAVVAGQRRSFEQQPAMFGQQSILLLLVLL